MVDYFSEEGFIIMLWLKWTISNLGPNFLFFTILFINTVGTLERKRNMPSKKHIFTKTTVLNKRFQSKWLFGLRNFRWINPIKFNQTTDYSYRFWFPRPSSNAKCLEKGLIVPEIFIQYLTLSLCLFLQFIWMKIIHYLWAIC